MSFILDALRKSENERQRKQQPGMAGMQVHKPRRGSGFWIPLVALLVGINLSLVFVMWVMGERELPLVSTTTSTPDMAVPQPQPRPSTSDLPTAQVSPGEELTALVSAESGPLTTLQTQPDIYYANASEEFGNLPTIEELILQNAITVEPLRLDIHVYSKKPSERFVFINMTKYTEGETLEEGPKLVAIHKDGIVLRHQGYEFLMSRE